MATLLNIVYYWLEKNSVVLDVRGEGVEDGELEESVEERGDKSFYELAARSKKNQYLHVCMYSCAHFCYVHVFNLYACLLPHKLK